MTELEKKTLKAQADLVQSVLEAYEKKNLERVDMLITNAIKQLKMSRFKPDQTTCISLTYLARTAPKIFTQSSVIKEVLKSLIRRDQCPTNIKGAGKTVDVVLPVLAANILLACCDTFDIRAIIIHKIEQWISGSQKATCLVQHLLATLCMKCQSDQQTITSLIDIRQHWLQYLEENYDSYGPVPSDLSANVKKLLLSETSVEFLIVYLNFLIKHDTNIVELSTHVSNVVLERPVTLANMLYDDKYGTELGSILIKVYTKLVETLKNNPLDEVKTESKADLKFKIDCVYVSLTSFDKPVSLSKLSARAMFTLLSLPMLTNENALTEDLRNLQKFWVVQVGKIQHIAFMYEDASMTVPYNIPTDLRVQLIHSADNLLVELALRGSTISQLMVMLQQFGLSVSTINMLLESLESMIGTETTNTEVGDNHFFTQLIGYYCTLGCPKAMQLGKKLQQLLPVS